MKKFFYSVLVIFLFSCSTDDIILIDESSNFRQLQPQEVSIGGLASCKGFNVVIDSYPINNGSIHIMDITNPKNCGFMRSAKINPKPVGGEVATITLDETSGAPLYRLDVNAAYENAHPNAEITITITGKGINKTIKVSAFPPDPSLGGIN